MLGSVEFLRHQSPIPDEKGVRFGNTRVSFRALRPSRFAISAKVDRSTSDKRRRDGKWALRMRFSAARYSLRSSNS